MAELPALELKKTRSEFSQKQKELAGSETLESYLESKKLLEPQRIWELIRYFAKFVKKYMIEQKSIERPWNLDLKSFRRKGTIFKVYHEAKIEKKRKVNKQEAKSLFANTTQNCLSPVNSNMPTNRRKRISNFNMGETHTTSRRKIASYSNDLYYEFTEVYEFGIVLIRCMGITREGEEGLRIMNKNDYRDFLGACFKSFRQKYDEKLINFASTLLVYDVTKRMKLEQFVHEASSCFELKFKISFKHDIENLKEAIKHKKNFCLFKLGIFTESNLELRAEGLKKISEIILSLENLRKLKLYIGWQNKIGNEGLNYVAEILLKMITIKKLSISLWGDNNITYEGFMKLGDSLKKLIFLKKFKLLNEGNIIGHAGIDRISKSCSQLKNLRKLILEFGQNSELGESGGKCLGEGFESLQTLTQLELMFGLNHNVTEEGFIHLARGISRIKNLEELILEIGPKSNIGNKAAIHIGDAVRNLINLKVLKLDIKYQNNLGDEGLKNLCSGLTELKELSVLYLIIGKENQVHAEGAIDMGECLQALTKLTYLNLDIRGNPIGVEGAIGLGLDLKNLTSLRKLKLTLEGNLIKDSGMRGIADGISNLRKLQSLLLDIGFEKGNEISEYGTMALGFAFKELENLEILKLIIGEKNNIGPVGAQHIGVGISHLLLLKYFELMIGTRNQIQSEGCRVICEGIGNLERLRNMSLKILSHNFIGLRGATSISIALCQLPKLIQLNLELGTSNDLGYLASVELSNGIMELSNLTKLKLDIWAYIGAFGKGLLEKTKELVQSREKLVFQAYSANKFLFKFLGDTYIEDILKML